jgi:hypothetical protein
LHKLHADETQTTALNAADHLADQPALHPIRLDENQCAFQNTLPLYDNQAAHRTKV